MIATTPNSPPKSLPNAKAKAKQFLLKDIIDPAYPLLEANREAIEFIEKRTYRYGREDQHQLDAYYPTPAELTTLVPILVFFYGGGFTHGSRAGANPPFDLIHSNLGAFFASRGILTIIPDYRLVTSDGQSSTFPQGPEDVRDALRWIITDRYKVLGVNGGEIYLLGHSAGGIHLSSFLLTPGLFTSPISEAVKGVMLLGVPYEITPARENLYAAALLYYGSSKSISKNQPINLLRRAEMTYVASLPPIRNAIAESEPKAIKGPTRIFTREFEKKGGVIQELVLDGHDHLSPILALSSGVGEEWGEDVVRWIASSISSERWSVDETF